MTFPGAVAVGDPIRATTFDQVLGAVATTASGTVTTGATVANTPKSIAITFPAGRFATAPVVCVTAVTSAPGTGVTGVGVTGSTATGCTLWVTTVTSTGGATLQWFAAVTP